jgi:lysophospholipase L1-like esterase
MTYLLPLLFLLSLALPAHALQFARLDALIGLPPVNGGIVLLGDSKTAFGPWDDLIGPCFNRGVSGMTTAQLLKYLPDLVPGYPDEIRIELGVNDFLLAGIGPYVSYRNYVKILEWIRDNRPAARVTVYSTLPTRRPYFNQRITILNDLLSAYIAGQGEGSMIAWIDLWPAMTDEQGLLRREFTVEGIHLNAQGYLQWTKEACHE